MLESELVILYEDNHIIVVLKPQNVACCPDESGDDNLFDCVKRSEDRRFFLSTGNARIEKFPAAQGIIICNRQKHGNVFKL